MLTLSVWKEWLEVSRDGRVKLCALAVLALLVVAMTGGWLDWSWYDQESRIGARNTDRQFTEQEEKHPHSAAHLGIFAWKPAAPLSVLDPGVNPSAGMTLWLEPHLITPAKLRPEQSLTALEKATRFSPAEVLRYFAPLLIVLIGAAQFAGEREAGTLRQTLSIGVSRWRLLQGKAFITSISPVALLVLFVAAGALAAASAEAPFTRTDAAMRLAFMTVGYVLYSLIWVALSLGVSALASSVRMALTVLVSLWALQTWVIPQAAGNLARINSAVLTPPAFVSRVLATQAERSAELESQLADAGARMLEEHDVEHLMDLPFNPDGILSRMREAFLNGIYDEEIEQQRNAFTRQRRDLLVASFFAPSLALRDWSMTAAGTDYDHHLHFTDAAEQHRRELVDYSYEALLATPYGVAYEDVLVDRAWFEGRPDLVYGPMSLRSGLRSAWASLVVLIGWAALAVLSAGWSVRKLRP